MNADKYMSLAILEAKRATIEVAPNPYVGAVLVKNGKIIGTGFHQKYGSAHAEVNAIENATESIEGSELYVTLEPCCHTNKQTPPCTDLIIKSGIKKIYIGSTDPNANVAGRGIKLLRAAGIEVQTNILKKECNDLNKIFFKFITTGLPYVHLKYAQTLDGKIATSSNDSKWISGEESRKLVHEQRRNYQSILIGANTARFDNPSLTSRLENTYCPIRFIVSQSNNFDHTLHLFSDEFKSKTKILTPTTDSFKDILLKIANEKISSVYIEGGQSIISQILKDNLWDELSIFMAPKIVGRGLGATDSIEIEKMQEAIELSYSSIDKVGNDLHINIRR